MARKPKNRDDSRTLAGGLRETRRVASVRRDTERRYDDKAYTSPLDNLFRPDLRAFEHVELVDYNRGLARNDSVASGSISRSRDLSPSRYKLASKQVTRKPGAAKSLQDRKEPQFGGQKITAKPVVSHEVRSPARVERVRSTCKERPRDNKPKGGGGSRAYVPWCDRKRK